MMKKIKNASRKILPDYLLRKYGQFLIKKAQFYHSIALRKIRRKNVIKVAFFVLNDAVWKYDELFKLMLKSERFNPFVVICPATKQDKQILLSQMDRVETTFKKRDYPCYTTYDKKNDSWLDVKKELAPDLIFFTIPHLITMKKYSILNFKTTLTCYTPYSFHVTYDNAIQYDQFFHNILWKAFYETEIHREMAVQTSRNKGENIEVTGFPGIDKFLKSDYKPEEVWKNTSSRFKKIIWAPHHTIAENHKLGFSTFLNYSEYFLELSKKYRDQIQIAFKPHPLLKTKLYKYENWGKEKTDAYYDNWKNMSNGQLEEGPYEDLFLTSDALILDSASFMTEYLFVKKPSLFLLRDDNIPERLNKFGKIVFEKLYHAKTAEQITEFIERAVLQGVDSKLKERSEFLREKLLPGNEKTPSENIMEVLHYNLNQK